MVNFKPGRTFLSERAGYARLPRIVRRFEVLAGCAGAIALLFIGACSLDEALPSTWRLHANSESRLEAAGGDVEASSAAVLATLEQLFGAPDAPHWPGARPEGEGAQVLMDTANLYRGECSHCHGLEGHGNGPSSHFVNPKPWDFSIGVFPRSAPNGKGPELTALVEVLRNGIPASSMPKFDRLGTEKLTFLSGHVLWLTRRAQFETRLVTEYLEKGPAVLEPQAAFELYEVFTKELEQALSRPVD